MSKNSKQKGKRGELELKNLFAEHGLDARRGQQYCGVAGDADVVGVPGIHVECKRAEVLKAYDYLEQAQSDAREGELPTVFYRKSRKNWIVIMDFEDWMKMYNEYSEAVK